MVSFAERRVGSGPGYKSDKGRERKEDNFLNSGPSNA